MSKKCIMCEEQAEYKIKDGNEYYCSECAQEHFSDLSFLQKVEDEAQQLKEILKDKMNGNGEDTQEH